MVGSIHSKYYREQKIRGNGVIIHYDRLWPRTLRFSYVATNNHLP